MAKDTRNRKVNNPRKTYSTPKLLTLGRVAEVTLAGSGPNVEYDWRPFGPNYCGRSRRRPVFWNNC